MFWSFSVNFDLGKLIKNIAYTTRHAAERFTLISMVWKWRRISGSHIKKADDKSLSKSKLEGVYLFG